MAGGTEEEAWESGRKACPDGRAGAAAGSDRDGMVSLKQNKYITRESSLRRVPGCMGIKGKQKSYTMNFV